MARKARVFVTSKRGVLDPQGSAVNRALHAMRHGEQLFEALLAR